MLVTPEPTENNTIPIPNPTKLDHDDMVFRLVTVLGMGIGYTHLILLAVDWDIALERLLTSINGHLRRMDGVGNGVGLGGGGVCLAGRRGTFYSV